MFRGARLEALVSVFLFIRQEPSAWVKAKSDKVSIQSRNVKHEMPFCFLRAQYECYGFRMSLTCQFGLSARGGDPRSEI